MRLLHILLYPRSFYSLSSLLYQFLRFKSWYSFWTSKYLCSFSSLSISSPKVQSQELSQLLLVDFFYCHIMFLPRNQQRVSLACSQSLCSCPRLQHSNSVVYSFTVFKILNQQPANIFFSPQIFSCLSRLSHVRCPKWKFGQCLKWPCHQMFQFYERYLRTKHRLDCNCLTVIRIPKIVLIFELANVFIPLVHWVFSSATIQS